MAALPFHPATLSAALHAGYAAARLAATTTDPDCGGVSIAFQPNGSLRITSGTQTAFSRAYADPSPDSDPTGDPLPSTVMDLHSVINLRRHLAQCDPHDSIELRATTLTVALINNDSLNLTSAANRADALTPWAYSDLPAASLNTDIPEHLTPTSQSLTTALAEHGHPDPDSTLEIYTEDDDPHALTWYLGDWALGRTHTPA